MKPILNPHPHVENSKPENLRFCGHPPDNCKRIAVLACHGMGQQVCYETVDAVATTICKSVGNNWKVSGHGRVGISGFDDDIQLGRVTLRLRHNKRKEEREVHIYESYWAPLTEGRISVSGAFGFLLRSALDGMRHWAAEEGRFRWRVFADNNPDIPEQEHRVDRWVPLLLAFLLASIAVALVAGAVALRGCLRRVTRVRGD